MIKALRIILPLFLVGTSLSTIAVKPANAQRFCIPPGGEYISRGVRVGDGYDDNFGGADIVGTTAGARVNVRRTPNGHHDGSYGIVGESVNVVGVEMGPDCNTWFRVQFPQSGYVGWMRGDFIRLWVGRGIWD